MVTLTYTVTEKKSRLTESYSVLILIITER